MSEKPLRIIHCLRAPVGGLFRHVCDLAAAQAERGHLVGIIADASTGGDAAVARFEELSAACSLGVTRFAMSRLPGPGDLLAAYRVASVAGSLSPDVLHGHGAKGGAYARLAGTRLRGRGFSPIRAYTPHGGSLHYTGSTPAGMLFLALERFLARRTDVFLFESDFSRRVFADKICAPPALARVVHNGLRPAEFLPVVPAPDAADFVFVGELRTLKGIDTLLAALALVKGPEGGPTAVIAGAGVDGAALKRAAHDLGLSGRVSFPGAMPARRAFGLGRCVVVPSRAESLPYVILEAAAARLPIIATDVGGIPEIFGAQAAGLLPPDDPARLAAAMERFLQNPGAARSAADRLADDIAERFSLDIMAEGVMAAYIAASRPAIKRS